MARFYGHFAAAYGTIWFVLMVVAVITQSNIQTGEVGLIGFPVAAAIYAWFRVSQEPGGRGHEVQRLRERIARLEGQLDALRG